ncbi:hypothetical protein KC926_04035 [Candidatus Kaiserbacteria bacterium]|nr:hypothetical protein [Candidatus Kaiserbacteria bacterium]
MGDFFKTVFGAFAGPIFLFVGIGVMFYSFSLFDIDIRPNLSVVFALSPIWLPFVLFYIVFEQWKYYTQAKFVYDNGRTTLRIKLPQEVLKSPEAMESVLAQIHTPNSPDNLQQTYIDGRHPLISSLEIVSIGGEVRFYANVPTKKVKNSLEAQLYAQYPGIEVVEEKIDYAAEVVWDPKKWDMISFHLTKKGDDVYPIKTYIDYGMDKLPKEELKFEPMAPMLEHLGKAKPSERLWIQILMKPHAKQDFKSGSLKATGTWETKGKAEVDKIMGRDKGIALEETDNRPALTMAERDTIAAIERNTGKYAYEVAIRAMYIAEAGKFDPEMISPMLRSFSQNDIIGRNGIGVRWRTDFDYNFFSDYSGRRKIAMKKRELEEYKKRYYYRSDAKNFADTPKIMSVEELATIFHIPGTSVVTPTLTRVESTRKEAPANLPIG